jgi:hypothetical protein
MYRDHMDHPDWQPWETLIVLVTWADDRVVSFVLKDKCWAEYSPCQRTGQVFEAEGYYLELESNGPMLLGLI